MHAMHANYGSINELVTLLYAHYIMIMQSNDHIRKSSEFMLELYCP
jgi:hypothetical protein